MSPNIKAKIIISGVGTSCNSEEKGVSRCSSQLRVQSEGINR